VTKIIFEFTFEISSKQQGIIEFVVDSTTFHFHFISLVSE